MCWTKTGTMFLAKTTTLNILFSFEATSMCKRRHGLGSWKNCSYEISVVDFTYIAVWLVVTQNWLSLIQIKKTSNEWFRFGEGYVSIKELSTASGNAQKMKFSFKDFFSKCDQILRKLWIWSLVAFIKEIPNGKLHFLVSVAWRYDLLKKIKPNFWCI